MMAKSEQKRRYRFPKSRSKRLKEALELAKTLPGYGQVEGGYEVSPSASDLTGEVFAGLLKITEKWKGSAFLLDGSEVSKAQFLDTSASEEPTVEPAPGEPPAEVEPEPTPAEVEPEPTPEDPPTEVEPEPAPEEPPAEPEPEPTPEEPPAKSSSHKPPPSVAKPPEYQTPTDSTDKKGKGCCCLPPFLGGLMGAAVIILHLLAG